MECWEMDEEQLWEASSTTTGLDRADVLHELGARLYRRGAFEEAATSAESAAEVYLDEDRPGPAGRALVSRSRALRGAGRAEEAAESAARAADLLREQGSEAEIARALLERGCALMTLGDDEAAAPHLEDAERLASSADADLLAASIAMERGELEGRAGRREAAREAFERARALRRANADAEGVAVADDRIAAALIERGLLEEALDRLQAALDVWEVTRDQDRIAYATFRLGWTLSIAHRYDEALERLSRARALYHELEDLYAAARCDEQAAGALNGLGKHAQAVSLFRRAVSTFDAVGADGQMVIAKINLADALEDDGQAEEGRRVLRAAYEQACRMEEWHAACGAASRLATWLLEDGQADEAARVLEEVADHVDRDDLLEGSTFDIALARCALAEGDAERADELAAAVLSRLAGTDLDTVRGRACAIRADAAAALGRPGQEEHLRTRAVLLLVRAGQAEAARAELDGLPIDADGWDVSTSPTPGLADPGASEPLLVPQPPTPPRVDAHEG